MRIEIMETLPKGLDVDDHAGATTHGLQPRNMPFVQEFHPSWFQTDGAIRRQRPHGVSRGAPETQHHFQKLIPFFNNLTL